MSVSKWGPQDGIHRRVTQSAHAEFKHPKCLFFVCLFFFKAKGPSESVYQVCLFKHPLSDSSQMETRTSSQRATKELM